MNQERQEHRGYVLVKEFGLWVAYRSKDFKYIGDGLQGARLEDGKIPTDIDRKPLDTSDLEEAKKRLTKKRKPRSKRKPGIQLSMLE
jgi:hypothetical protein